MAESQRPAWRQRAAAGGRRAGYQALRHTPGVALLAVIAALAGALGALTPAAISDVFLALVAGAALANVAGLPRVCAAGVRLGPRTLLRLGIVLIGARLSFDAVVGIGAQSVLFVLAAFGIGLSTAWFVARRFGLNPRLAMLLAIGTAICGNSAIIAASPVIKAKRHEIAYAVATITLFGTLAVLVYPIVGQLLEIPSAAFGVWAGTAVNDTAQVVATAYAFSEPAGDTATIVKLTRNLLIGPVLIVLAVWTARRETVARRRGVGAQLRLLRRALPLFVLGFLAMAALNTLGAFDANTSANLQRAGSFSIAMAVAGIGLTTDIRHLTSAGMRPLLTGLIASLVLATLSLAAVLAFWS